VEEPAGKDFVSQVKEPKLDFIPQGKKKRGDISRLVEERDCDNIGGYIGYLSLDPREGPSCDVGANFCIVGLKPFGFQGPAVQKS